MTSLVLPKYDFWVLTTVLTQITSLFHSHYFSIVTVQEASLGPLLLCCRMAGRTPEVRRTAVNLPDTHESPHPAVPLPPPSLRPLIVEIVPLPQR